MQPPVSHHRPDWPGAPTGDSIYADSRELGCPCFTAASRSAAYCSYAAAAGARFAREAAHYQARHALRPGKVEVCGFAGSGARVHKLKIRGPEDGERINATPGRLRLDANRRLSRDALLALCARIDWALKPKLATSRTVSRSASRTRPQAQDSPHFADLRASGAVS